MIGPWKRVAELEGEKIALLSRVAFLEGQAADAHATVLDLTAKIVEMRRDGFNPPPEQPKYAPTEGGLPDEVLAAMEDRASPGSPGWDRLGTYARKLLRDGNAQDEVAKAVLEGEGWAGW